MPALEIDLLPIAPTTGDSGSHLGAPQPAPDRRWRRFTIAAVIVVVAVFFVALNAIGDDEPDPEAVTPAPALTSAPTTLGTLGPNILGTESTGLLLWTFDSQSRLQVLDLDSGELRRLGVRGGFALFPLYRNVVVFDGDNGSSIVSPIGATSASELGKAVYPVVERDTRKLWVISNDAPRQWQQRAVDGTVLDVLPFDGRVSIVPYSDHAVLLVSVEGTSLFDLVTRQREFLTPTPVFAAGGPNMIGRTCANQHCTFTVIDTETRKERVLLSDVPVDDARNAMLSPDGDYLAISRVDPAIGRRGEILAVSTGAPLWQSPVAASAPLSWSWSPDSRWLFLTTSNREVLVVDMRTPWVRTAITLPVASLHGLAVTYL
jgi:hypothetical protein